MQKTKDIQRAIAESKSKKLTSALRQKADMRWIFRSASFNRMSQKREGE